MSQYRIALRIRGFEAGSETKGTDTLTLELVNFYFLLISIETKPIFDTELQQFRQLF